MRESPKDLMIDDVKQTKRRGIFYGWWIVAGGTTVWALQAGVYYYGFSTFFTALISEFGWSRTALSLVTSLSRLESGIAGPIVGLLVDRLGTRGLMLAGITLAGLGYVLLSQVNSIEMFALVFVLVLSMGASLGFGAPSSAAVANWFVRRRSMAFGIMTCGVGLGGLVLPLIAWSISRYGWRVTAIACGILLLVAGVPLSLVMRHKPEPYGYLPDGDDFPSSDNKTLGSMESENKAELSAGSNVGIAASAERIEEQSFTPKQAVATTAFWTLSLVFTSRSIVIGGLGIHEIPALEHLGFSREIAATILMLMTLISVPGRLLFGWLGDRFDKRHLIGACLLMMSAGLTAFALATDLSLIIVFLLVFSPAYGGAVPLMPAIFGEYFGRKFFATINGLTQAITMWGTIIAPVVAGYIFDVSGSYQIAFLLFAASNLVGLLLLLLVRKPQPQLAHRSAKTKASYG